MALTHEYGLMHFMFNNNASYDSEVMTPWLCDISSIDTCLVHS
jgi:hypothetical protein